MQQTYYQILGVSDTATAAEIEAAFKSKAREVHPDKIAPGDAYLRKIASEAFKELSEAKTVLLDAAKRQKYDDHLARLRGRSSSRGAVGSQAARPEPAFYATPAPSPTTRRTPHSRLGLAIFLVLSLFLAGLRWSWISSRSPAATPATATPAIANPSLVSSPAEPSTLKGNSPASKTASASPKVRASDKGARSINTHDSHSITLWRSTEPPDLSSFGSSERLAIESACSYAKTQSPETYNGCLVQQLAIHAATPPPDLSHLPAPQREAIEAACSSAKLVQGLAAYSQCVAQRLEASKHRAP